MSRSISAFQIYFLNNLNVINKPIVANHVQNARSSPSLSGSYAESFTVAWDDEINHFNYMFGFLMETGNIKLILYNK